MKIFSTQEVSLRRDHLPPSLDSRFKGRTSSRRSHMNGRTSLELLSKQTLRRLVASPRSNSTSAAFSVESIIWAAMNWASLGDSISLRPVKLTTSPCQRIWICTRTRSGSNSNQICSDKTWSCCRSRLRMLEIVIAKFMKRSLQIRLRCSRWTNWPKFSKIKAVTNNFQKSKIFCKREKENSSTCSRPLCASQATTPISTRTCWCPSMISSSVWRHSVSRCRIR